VVVVSFLLGGLLVGGREVQPAGIPLMLQGVLLFSLLACEAAVRYRIVFEPEPAAEEAR
jgi:simple sugar transport system permease protein